MNHSGTTPASHHRTPLYVAGLLALWIGLLVIITSFALPPESAFVAPTPAMREHPLPEPPAPLSYVIPPGFERIHYWADVRGLPHWLVARTFAVENTGDPMNGNWTGRTSAAGAKGYAQVMPVNFGLFSLLYLDGAPFDPMNIEQCIRVLTGYLADNTRASGSWRIGVMAYNGGLGHWVNPRRWGAWQDESVDYATRILGGAR